MKYYIIGTLIFILGVYFYSENKGYNKCKSDYNNSIINLIRENQKKEAELSKKINNLTKELENEKTWSNSIVPSNIKRMLMQ